MLFTTNTVHCVGGSEFFNVCESKENLLRYIIGGYVMNRRSVQSGCVLFSSKVLGTCERHPILAIHGEDFVREFSYYS